MPPGKRSRTSRMALAPFATFLVLVGHAFPSLVGAQADAPVLWRAEPKPGSVWSAVLRIDADRVAGLVSACLSGPGPIEIHDGVIRGSTLEFRCTGQDDSGTLVFTGTIARDELVLTWTRQAAESGSTSTLPAAALFGADTPSRFTARPVPPSTFAETRLIERVARIPKVLRVSFDRIVRSREEAHNWLTYSGSLDGWRHSPLTHLTPDNVTGLEMAWLLQARTALPISATPLVVDGVMFTTQDANDVVALDAVTGQTLWRHEYTPHPKALAGGGGGRPNRGLAILDGTLFMGTLDAHVIAIDAYTGKRVWSSPIADALDPNCGTQRCYVITHAPLVVKDKVIVGVGGGEGPIRGFLVALDAKSGKEVWRFNTVPGRGEPGQETWAGESWARGGAGIWNIGAYDPELNLGDVPSAVGIQRRLE